MKKCIKGYVFLAVRPTEVPQKEAGIAAEEMFHNHNLDLTQSSEWKYSYLSTKLLNFSQFLYAYDQI